MNTFSRNSFNPKFPANSVVLRHYKKVTSTDLEPLVKLRLTRLPLRYGGYIWNYVFQTEISFQYHGFFLLSVKLIKLQICIN